MDLELSLSTKTEDLPDFMRAEAPDAGRLANEDGLFQVPFLKILNGLSDQVSKRIGMIGDIWSGAHEKVLGGPKTPVYLIPVNVKRSWTKFDGKKLLWTTDDPKDSRVTEAGDEAFKLSRLQVMVIAPVRPDFHDCKPMVFSFAGTSHKVGAGWYRQFTNQSALKFNAPFYGQVWAMSSVEASNDKGTWYQPSMSFAGIVKDKDAFLASKGLFDHFNTQKWASTEDAE